jgi:hypothetical protein
MELICWGISQYVSVVIVITDCRKFKKKKRYFATVIRGEKKIHTQILENRSSGTRFEMGTRIRQMNRYIQTARWHHKPTFLLKEKK